MAEIRQTKTSMLFRVLVVPAMLLCGIFRKPVFQWIAVFAMIVWLSALIATLVNGRREKSKKSRAVNHLQLMDSPVEEKSEKNPLPENDLFLIRQVNYRITEHLKQTYPMVTWLWTKTPSAAELCKGGIWRIRVSNTEPFNYGEVSLSGSGKLTINMLQVMALGEALQPVPEPSDLKQEDLLDRIDVKTWYHTHGEQILAQMIDDLNAQGHRQLTIKETGEVIVASAGIQQPIDTIPNFPPRMMWEEFGQLLSEDDIEATVMPDCLILAW